MQKTRQIVMLPTDEKSCLFFEYGDLWIGYDRSKCDASETIPQHLYVLSDEKINAGDIIFWSMGNKGYIGVAGVDVIYNGNTKKVIATTDSSFTKKKQIKLIPYSFLPEFVDAWNKNKISEVELEYNDESDLKTNEANEVSISIQNVVLDNIQLASEQFNRTLDRNKKYGMNIIEAMQQAENGFAINNHILKIEDAFLIYIKNGFFSKYVLFDGEPLYINTFDTFTTAQILCKSWEVLPENYRNKIFKNN